MTRMRTIKQAAEEIRQADKNTAVTEYFLRECCKSGEIRCIKSGNKYLVSLDEIEAYCAGTYHDS
jgi:hypothetical protein